MKSATARPPLSNWAIACEARSSFLPNISADEDTAQAQAGWTDLDRSGDRRARIPANVFAQRLFLRHQLLDVEFAPQ
jgi:hypothetical protein